MHLAFEQHWVDHHAKIVDRRVAEQFDAPRIGIDLDFAHVATGGKAVGGGLVEVLRLQARRNIRRQSGGMSGARDVDTARSV